MTSELLYLLSDCEMTVLPHPKAPGIAVVPPCTTGNSASSTRWPVSSGVLAATFSTHGRGTRTGHVCIIVCLACRKELSEI